MTQIRPSVNRIANKKRNMDSGKSACLGCGKHLAYCGEPFSAEIVCPHCGAVNVYVDSQKPSEVRVQRGR
jgi:phage FluMu protein Com